MGTENDKKKRLGAKCAAKDIADCRALRYICGSTPDNSRLDAQCVARDFPYRVALRDT